MDLSKLDGAAEKAKSLRGELYHAFAPQLIKERARCSRACNRFNKADNLSRRQQVEMWRDIVQDPRPLPPVAATPEEDDELFILDPWVEPPLRIDYGTNVKLGDNVFLNFNCVILDTCLVTIGARTLVGPDVKFYSGTHPLDPVIRNGTNGPELGKEIHVGEDVWIGGTVTILPGVKIGKGATIGAGSVVTKDVPPFTVAAGNPARILKKIQTSMDPDQKQNTKAETAGAENPMAELAEKLDNLES